MDAHLRRRVEIETLHEILNDLDHYKLLRVPRDATTEEIERAYRDAARAYHPDRLARLGDADITQRANDIYRAIQEAWRVLRDHAARAEYDDGLADQPSSRAASAFSIDTATDAELLAAARTDKGAKYWALAVQAWRNGDYKGCALHTSFALSFEPDNPVFLEMQKRAREEADQAARDNHNPYKLRIV